LRQEHLFTKSGTAQHVYNDIAPSFYGKLIHNLEMDLRETLEHNNSLRGRNNTTLMPAVSSLEPPFHTTLNNNNCVLTLFDMLPEVLMHILTFLTPKEVCTTSFVCKTAYWYCMQDYVWKELFFQRFNTSKLPTHVLHAPLVLGVTTKIPFWKQLFSERWLFAAQRVKSHTLAEVVDDYK
jgi:hypothetical protein